jgi:hypothetical protein
VPPDSYDTGTCEAFAPTLPGGLGLDPATGAISGTPAPASEGSYVVTVSLADALGVTATAATSIVVVSPPVLTTASLPDATVGVPYAQALQAAGGVVSVASPYRWALGKGEHLSDGLSLSPDGVIAPASMPSLRAVAPSRQTDTAVAVGDGGSVLHYDGTTWTPETSGTADNLYAVAFDGSCSFRTDIASCLMPAGAGGTLEYPSGSASPSSGTTWHMSTSGPGRARRTSRASMKPTQPTNARSGPVVARIVPPSPG